MKHETKFDTIALFPILIWHSDAVKCRSFYNSFVLVFCFFFFFILQFNNAKIYFIIIMNKLFKKKNRLENVQMKTCNLKLKKQNFHMNYILACLVIYKFQGIKHFSHPTRMAFNSPPFNWIQHNFNMFVIEPQNEKSSDIKSMMMASWFNVFLFVWWCAFVLFDKW
jgi:hypothetical protein